MKIQALVCFLPLRNFFRCFAVVNIKMHQPFIIAVGHVVNVFMKPEQIWI